MKKCILSRSLFLALLIITSYKAEARNINVEAPKNSMAFYNNTNESLEYGMALLPHCGGSPSYAPIYGSDTVPVGYTDCFPSKTLTGIWYQYRGNQKNVTFTKPIQLPLQQDTLITLEDAANGIVSVNAMPKKLLLFYNQSNLILPNNIELIPLCGSTDIKQPMFPQETVTVNYDKCSDPLIGIKYSYVNGPIVFKACTLPATVSLPLTQNTIINLTDPANCGINISNF